MNVLRESRFVTAADGTSIAWHEHRLRELPETRPPDRSPVVLTNGIATSDSFWKHVVHVLAREHPLAHWDYRAHGWSEPSVTDDYETATHGDDLRRVTEAFLAGTPRSKAAVHVAFSMGVTVVLELYRRRPDLVRGMVLIAGTPDAPGTPGLPFRVPGMMPLARGALAALTPFTLPAGPVVRAAAQTPTLYPLARALKLVRPGASRDDMDELLTHFRAMDTRALWLTLRGLMRAHASDVLPQVRCPVLVVAARHDSLAPEAHVRQMAARIPGAQYLCIERVGHAGLIESGPDFAAAIRRFLRGL